MCLPDGEIRLSQMFEDGKTVVLNEKQLFEKKIHESQVSKLTKEKILQLYGYFSEDMFFSRADVMKIAGITSSPAGDLIKKMKKEKNILETECVTKEFKVHAAVDTGNIRRADTGKKKAGAFSLGMKQRLGIGITLLNHTKLLSLDVN